MIIMLICKHISLHSKIFSDFPDFRVGGDLDVGRSQLVGADPWT